MSAALHLQSNLLPSEAIHYAELAGDEHFVAGFHRGEEAAKDFRMEQRFEEEDRIAELEGDLIEEGFKVDSLINECSDLRDLIDEVVGIASLPLQLEAALRRVAQNEDDAIEAALDLIAEHKKEVAK